MPPATQYRRSIGLVSGVAFVVGIIIGSGIFISPKGVYLNALCSPAWSLAVWCACGVFSMLGSLVYAELGTTLARSGGDYAYIKEGLGEVPSFLYLWLNIVVIRPASQAILALTSAYYLLGAFAEPSCSQSQLEVPARLVAALLISSLTVLNCANVKWSLHFQNVFTSLKVLALMFIVLVGASQAFLDWSSSATSDPSQNVAPVSSLSSSLPSPQCQSHFSLSLYSGLFAFGGWNYLNIVTDELKHPYKNLPRAALAGIFLSSVIYILVNVSYFIVLAGDDILTSPTIALTFARKTVGPLGVLFISLSISCSALGALNATLFTTSRLFTTAAHSSQLPRVLGMLHPTRCTPIPSLGLSLLVTYLTLLAGDVYQLINFFSFTYWLWTGVAVISGIYLRHTQPHLARPIRLPLLVLYFFLLLCLSLTGLAVYNDPLNSAIGVGLVLAGLPFYVIKLASDRTGFSLSSLTTFLQKLFLVVDVEESENEAEEAHL